MEETKGGFYNMTIRYGDNWLLIVPGIATILTPHELDQVKPFSLVALKNFFSNKFEKDTNPNQYLEALVQYKDQLTAFLNWLNGDKSILKELLPDEANFKYTLESQQLIFGFKPKLSHPYLPFDGLYLERIIALIAASSLSPRSIEQPFFDLWRHRNPNFSLFETGYDFTYRYSKEIVTTTILDSSNTTVNNFPIYNLRINGPNKTKEWLIYISECTLFDTHVEAVRSLLLNS